MEKISDCGKQKQMMRNRSNLEKTFNLTKKIKNKIIDVELLFLQFAIITEMK